MKSTKVASGLLLATLVSACATSVLQPTSPISTSNGILTNRDGMTLYVFDKDFAGDGKSACYDMCAKNWPPLNAKEGDTAYGELSIITRNDGSKQWTFRGKPLYLWIKDLRPGDKTGDGFNKLWHIVTP